MNKIFENDLIILRGGGTRNLRLRPIQEKDTEMIVRWRNTKAIQSQFIFRETFTSEMHNNWLKTKVFPGYVIQYIIEVGDNNSPIGSIYIRDIDLQNESGEFGIFIGETNYISKGYGTLAAQIFVPYCFTLGFHRIFLRVFAENEAAQKSYAKVGFSKEGVARHMVYLEGTRRDIVFMSIVNK